MWAKKKILTSLFLAFIVMFCAAPSLIWDRNPETNVVGYRVYEGRVSRGYDQVVDVGNAITVYLANPPINVMAFYAVTAYDNDGLESGYSLEVTFLDPASTNWNPGGGTNGTPGGTNNPPGGTNQPPSTNYPPIVLQVAKAPTGVIIFFQAEANVIYHVELTYDFVDWYGYTQLSRTTDGTLDIPLWTSYAGNAFFRVRRDL